MGRSHLSFIEHSAAATVEAIRLFSAESKKVSDKRDFIRIASGLRELHLGFEKLIKHCLAEIDPYLLLSRPDPGFIRSVRKEVISLNAPSIFAVRQRVVTLTLDEAWNVLLDVAPPALPAQKVTAFSFSVKALTEVRNMAQHGELFFESDELLKIQEDVLSGLRIISDAICPDYVDRLITRNKNVVTALRAIEERVDSGWILLNDFLKKRKRLVVDFGMHATLLPDRQVVDVSIHSARTTSSTLSAMLDKRPSLSGRLSLSASNSGLFGHRLTVEEAEVRDARRRALLKKQRLILPAIPWVHPNTFELSFAPTAWEPSDTLIKTALSRRREEIERSGLVPLEAGELYAEAFPAWLRFPSGERGAAALNESTDVLLTNFRMRLTPRRRKGTVAAKIYPGGVRASPEARQPLSCTGSVWLTSEFTITPERAEETLPVETVLRFFRGRLNIKASG